MKFMHASQRYRPQMALFGYRWIIKVAEWVAKAGLEPREIANARL